MPGIAVISNPNSRRNQRQPEIAGELRQMLGGAGLFVETQTIEAIPEAARRLLEADPEVLAISGGDGTLHYTITDLARVYAEAGRELPAIALLRGGTMNTISKGMKTLSGSPVSILGRVLEKHRQGARFLLTERHALSINQGEQLGFLFGLGLSANLLEAYYEGRGTGPAKGAYVLARLVLSTLIWGRYAQRLFHRVPAFVAGDGRESPYENYTVILAGTVTEIGLGFAPLSRTLDREGRFHFLAGALSPISLTAQLSRIYTGAPLRGAIFDEVVEEARIEVDGDYSYMIDGDVKRGIRSFRLSVGPRVRFIKD